MNIKQTDIACDLSASTLTDAANMLAAPLNLVNDKLVFRLQVNYQRIVSCLAAANATNLKLHIEVTPLGQPDSWALWLWDDCIWSPGA